MSEPASGSVRRPASRSSRGGTLRLGLGSAGNGLLAYLVFALTTRALGAERAAPVSVLWSYWAFAGAAFTFPLQHWATRTVEAHGEATVRRALPQVAVVTLAAALVLAVLAWSVRMPLFGRQDAWFPVMVGVVTVGSATIGLVRGGLAARDRLGGVAASLVAENGLRCVAVGALGLAGVRSPVPFGMCLVAGHLVAVCWPSAWRYRRGPVPETAPATPFGFLAGAGAAQLVAQTVLTGGPVVLALSGGSPRQVTTLFAALALFRAPYMLALGLVAALTAGVTRMAVGGHLSRLRTMLRGTLAATVAGVLLAGAGAAWLGPWLLRLVFGADVVLGHWQAAVVAVGCTVAIANLLLVVLALAQDRAGSVAASWLVSVVAAAAGFAALSRWNGLDAADRVVWAFLVAETLALLALGMSGSRAVRRHGSAG